MKKRLSLTILVCPIFLVLTAPPLLAEAAGTTLPNLPNAPAVASKPPHVAAVPPSIPLSPNTPPYAPWANQYQQNAQTATSVLEKEIQVLSIGNMLEDERLKKQFQALRSQLQQLSWERSLLEEKINIARLKNDIANKEENEQHQEALLKLQRENDLLVQRLSIAKTNYELNQHKANAEHEKLMAKLQNEKQQLQENIDIERLKKEQAERALTLAHEEKLQALSRQKALLTEALVVKNLQRDEALYKARVEFDDRFTAISRDALLAKETAEKLSNELAIKQAEWRSQTIQLEAEIEKLEIEKKHRSYVNADPVYLENPVTEDGTLVISDRRIALNGVIRQGTADYVTSRINYYNNKDQKLPIFIVIDSSPGGSVMEGYRILKSMEGSVAPVYVLVKSLAASMAATITALAEKSFAYPNALFLHHQMSRNITFMSLNLTEQKELHENSQRWWNRLAKPVADKMGLTLDEFVAKMYEHSSKGDWTEFGTAAQKLKWVDQIVERVSETSLLKDPNSEEAKFTSELKEDVNEHGKPVMYLPRLSPMDYYYLYNPDNYYRMR